MEPTQQQPLAIWNTARDAWETPQTEGLFCEHLDVYSETFPTSGMTVNGVAYALPTWEPATDDSVYSSLLMTPVASEGAKPSNTMGVARRLTTGQVFLTNQIVTLCGLDPSEKLLPTSVALNLMPTPQAHDAQKGKTAEQVAAMRARGHGVANLNELAENELVLLRTPCASEAAGGPRNPNRPGATMRLSDQVREEVGRGLLLPTPVAQPSGNTPEDHLRKKPGRKVVTDLAILTENGLLETGGQLPGQMDIMEVL